MTIEQHRPELYSDDVEKPQNPSVGSMNYIDTFFDPDATEARKRRQEEITRRMSEMVIAEYQKRIKERKEQWWFGFNQDTDYE